MSGVRQSGGGVDEKFSLLCTWMMRVEDVQEDS